MPIATTYTKERIKRKTKARQISKEKEEIPLPQSTETTAVLDSITTIEHLDVVSNNRPENEFESKPTLPRVLTLSYEDKSSSMASLSTSLEPNFCISKGVLEISKDDRVQIFDVQEPELSISPKLNTPEQTNTDQSNKKRGRKPRGGKLILRPSDVHEQVRSITNVILHLKCSLKDLTDYNTHINRIVTDPLKYNPDIPPEIVTYNDKSTGFTTFQSANVIQQTEPPHQADECKTIYSSPYVQCSTCKTTTADYTSDFVGKFGTGHTDNVNIKDINAKLKQLKVQLYKNAIQLDKKSACFWCTYDFDNIPCHIPKYEMEETIYGYGSFCRPECAVAYLMKENIDDSMKFERYQLLNQIYSKIYECKKNIKPAPNPYYLLDKYYGNLTIQEYRKLLKTEHLLLVIDKPLTRILPELHEDNEDMIMNIYGINKSTENISGVYKVKRQSEKQQGPSKASIIRSKFGLC